MKVTFKYCDCCGADITEVKQELGYLKYNNKPNGATENRHVNLDDVCGVCLDKIHNFVESLKKENKK